MVNPVANLEAFETYASSSATEPKQHKVDITKDLFGLPAPYFFLVSIGLCFFLYDWTTSYLFSSAALLTFSILLGATRGHRILAHVPLPILLGAIHSFYLVCSTSWLLMYFLYIPVSYIANLVVAINQFEEVQNVVRRTLRSFAKELHWFEDKVAFFDLPALEIDKDVDGMMVVRGMTFCFSTFTLEAHGIEVGIKLSDDMGIAIQVEKVVVSLCRKIEIGDVYANVKGGEYEMTFGHLDETARKAQNGEAQFKKNLQNGTTGQESMKNEFTGGKAPKNATISQAAEETKVLNPEDAEAGVRFKAYLDWIHTENTIAKAREFVHRTMNDVDEPKDIRAAICSHLQKEDSVPHPPKWSVKVTTLEKVMPMWLREIVDNLPGLLRGFLNPVAYLHPVFIGSVNAAGSGRWIASLLKNKIFKGWADESGEVARLENKIQTWLEVANFSIGLSEVTGLAQVPWVLSYNILTYLKFKDVQVFRTLEEKSVCEVVRFGGASATFGIPTYLLPHHEEYLPPVPSVESKAKKQQVVDDADGHPETFKAQKDLDREHEDECTVEIGAHISLPAVLDVEILQFIAAVVKATQVISLNESAQQANKEVKHAGFGQFGSAVVHTTAEHLKKRVVEAHVDDEWIAKMVAKLTKKLEQATGDLGYTGEIPVKLAPYRGLAKRKREGKA